MGKAAEYMIIPGISSHQVVSQWSPPLGTWLQKEDRPQRPKATRDPGDRKVLPGKLQSSEFSNHGLGHSHHLRTHPKYKFQDLLEFLGLLILDLLSQEPWG